MRILELIVSMIINFLDIVFVYLIVHNLLKEKIKLSAKLIVLGILYGGVFGASAIYLSGGVFRAVVTLTILLAIKFISGFISGKKIHDILILYVLTFLFISFIQLFSILLITQISFDDLYIRLLGQIITAIVVLIWSLKVPMYKVFYTIEKEIILKLFFFTLTGVFLLVFAYFGFEYENIVPHLFFFFLLLIPAVLGFLETIRRMMYYTTEVPEKIHDIRNLIAGLDISVEVAPDLDAVKKELANLVSLIELSETMGGVQVGDIQGGILKFINQKKEERAKGLTIIANVGCAEVHQKVSLSVILYMIGTLLDNATESGTKDPILVDINITNERLEIEVSNSCDREAVEKIKTAMHLRKQSTKPGESRGYGLSNLKKTVERYGGKVGVAYHYNDEYEKNYLNLSVWI